MTQEEIIEMVNQVGCVSYTPPPTRAVKGASMTFTQLEALAKLIRQRFAEECIDLVAFYGGSVDLEAAIRKQGETI